MRTITQFINGSRMSWSACGLVLKYFIIVGITMTASLLPIQAQETQYRKPSFLIGAAAGVNFNDYRGTTQQMNDELLLPAGFHHGKGAGLYVAPLLEFQRPQSKWGAMLQVGYDSRKGSFNQILTPCNCPADLSTNLSYLTVEPALRFKPFGSGFYLYAGPRLAFNTSKSFTYSQKTNPAYEEQVADPDIKGDFSKVHKTLLSFQIGAGYDIALSPQTSKTQYVLSPFVSFQPYFGQSPRAIETWTVTTLRLGAAIKIGRGKAIREAQRILVSDLDVKFSVHSPENIPVERRVRETFPLRNYVFFNPGSAEIPTRYVLLKKEQVKDFKEDQLEVFAPKRLSGRSKREMVVYYNVLNILGDRMGKDPETTITLVGSSEKGQTDGEAMANSVKQYLTNVFIIDASRINIEGRSKPKIPSEQPGGKLELKLLREGDRRVSIESHSPSLLMEFQSGPDAPLKPVEFVAVQVAPPDSYVSFLVEGANEAFVSWSLEIRDAKGKVQHFGPYTQEKVSIPGKSILGDRPQGTYKVTMAGKTNIGMKVTKETTVHMVLWTPDKNEEGMRYSVIFEFNASKAIAIYEKYLTDIVTPKITPNATVIIHGHTDLIGNENNNRELSWARANDVRSTIEKALSDNGIKGVQFEVYGFGEDEKLSPFENKFPEERFYNRTVIIDIIPKTQ